jgi:hypothetical protein
MATAIPVCRTARQAKRAGPDLEAGPEASAERSEGTMEARRGETPQAARCAARQRDRPCFLAGDARTSMLDEHHAQDGPHAQGIEKLLCCWDCDWLLADPAQPVRRSSRGAKHRAAGIGRRAFPWRQAKRAAPRQARRLQAESSGRRLDSETGIHGEDEFSR